MAAIVFLNCVSPPARPASERRDHDEQISAKARHVGLFKNDQKDREEDRDFKGSLTLPDGTELWVSGWRRKTKSGETYLGGTVKLKNEAPKSSGDAKRSLRDPF